MGVDKGNLQVVMDDVEMIYSGKLPNNFVFLRYILTRSSNYGVFLCVLFPFILDIKFVGRTSRGHTRRKVTQDFSSIFFLRCVP